MFDKGQKQSSTLSCDSSYFLIDGAHTIIENGLVDAAITSTHNKCFE